MSRLLLLALFALSLVVPQAGDASSPDGDADIVGLALGMTPEEVRSAIEQHSPALKIQESEGRIPLADGSVRTYVARLSATSARRRGEEIRVEFAWPPRELRAVSIGRYQEFPIGSRPSGEALREAIVAKYGPPDETKEERPPFVVPSLPGVPSHLGDTQLRWRLDDGRQDCVKIAMVPGKGVPRPIRSSLKGNPPEQCSRMLIIGLSLMEDGVDKLGSVLVNPELTALMQEEFRELRSRQQQERMRRQQTDTAPKL